MLHPSGTILEGELVPAAISGRVSMMSRKEFCALMDREFVHADKDGNHEIDWDEFVDYYNGLMDRLRLPGAFNFHVEPPPPEPPKPKPPPLKPLPSRRFSTMGTVGKRLHVEMGAEPEPELLAAMNVQVRPALVSFCVEALARLTL